MASLPRLTQEPFGVPTQESLSSSNEPEQIPEGITLNEQKCMWLSILKVSLHSPWIHYFLSYGKSEPQAMGYDMGQNSLPHDRQEARSDQEWKQEGRR